MPATKAQTGNIAQLDRGLLYSFDQGFGTALSWVPPPATWRSPRPGALTIDQALGGVTACRAHGRLRIREVSGGTIRHDNGQADVDVGVPTGVAA
jgi:hypothetical protein